METIHTRIKMRREALGLSMEAMAEALGVAWQTIQQWEREPVPDNPKVLSTAPKRTRIKAVAEYLLVTEEWLRTGKGEDGLPSNPIKTQLGMIYDALPDGFQENLLQHANSLLTLSRGNAKGPHNPYGK
jgi:DNA-binding XRE family transcriptional regulator